MKLALVFPGQGSQAMNMLADLAAKYEIVKKTFQEASEAINIDLWQLSQSGPIERLNQTEFTQPALLAAGVSVWRIWQTEIGLSPSFMAGHSLGEYTALVCAQALKFNAAVKLVHKRGRYMQEAVPSGEGAMAAILGLPDQEVSDICQEAANQQILAAANFNSPEQVVIAGETEAVERAIELAKNKGAKRALILPVSVPSHCALMLSAAARLTEDLEETKFSAPIIPVINNVDVTLYASPDEIRDGLIRQLYNSVRWVELINYLKQQGINIIAELGPGRVLTGLNKRIAPEINSLAIFDQLSLETAKSLGVL